MHAIAHGGVRTHVRESAPKVDSGRRNKSLGALGNHTCVSSVRVRYSTNWATSPPPHTHTPQGQFVLWQQLPVILGEIQRSRNVHVGKLGSLWKCLSEEFEHVFIMACYSSEAFCHESYTMYWGQGKGWLSLFSWLWIKSTRTLWDR